MRFVERERRLKFFESRLSKVGAVSDRADASAGGDVERIRYEVWLPLSRSYPMTGQ